MTDRRPDHERWTNWQDFAAAHRGWDSKYGDLDAQAYTLNTVLRGAIDRAARHRRQALAEWREIEVAA